MTPPCKTRLTIAVLVMTVGCHDGGLNPSCQTMEACGSEVSCLSTNGAELGNDCPVETEPLWCEWVENPSCGVPSTEVQLINASDDFCLRVGIRNDCNQDLSGDLCAEAYVDTEDGPQTEWTCLRFGVRAGSDLDHRVCHATGRYVAYWTTLVSEPNSVYELCNPLSGNL